MNSRSENRCKKTAKMEQRNGKEKRELTCIRIRSAKKAVTKIRGPWLALEEERYLAHISPTMDAIYEKNPRFSCTCLSVDGTPFFASGTSLEMHEGFTEGYIFSGDLSTFERLPDSAVLYVVTLFWLIDPVDKHIKSSNLSLRGEKKKRRKSNLE